MNKQLAPTRVTPAGRKEIGQAVAIAALSSLLTGLIGWGIEEGKRHVEARRKAATKACQAEPQKTEEPSCDTAAPQERGRKREEDADNKGGGNRFAEHAPMITANPISKREPLNDSERAGRET